MYNKLDALCCPYNCILTSQFSTFSDNVIFGWNFFLAFYSKQNQTFHILRLWIPCLFLLFLTQKCHLQMQQRQAQCLFKLMKKLV